MLYEILFINFLLNFSICLVILPIGKILFLFAIFLSHIFSCHDSHTRNMRTSESKNGRKQKLNKNLKQCLEIFRRKTNVIQNRSRIKT